MTTLTALFLLGPIGFQELLIVLLIVVLIFGAAKLPLLGKGLGEGIRNFKKGLKTTDESPVLEKGTETED